MEPAVDEETVTVEEAVASLKEVLNKAYAAEDRLKELLTAPGLMA